MGKKNNYKENKKIEEKYYDNVLTDSTVYTYSEDLVLKEIHHDIIESEYWDGINSSEILERVPEYFLHLCMKSGLFYILLAILTLLIVSSELKEREHTSDVTSTCRLIDTFAQNDCVIVAGSNSLKKLNPELVRFRIVHARILRQAYDQKIQQSIIKQRLRQSGPEKIQGIKSDALIIYNYSTEKEDDHHIL